MRSSLVYDLPTRLFHWLFSSLFLFSFIIAKTVDDDSIVFTYHMLSGLLLGGLILWRIIWGIIGSKYARFSGFNLNPLDLKDYFIGILSGSKKRWSGHNPASSWAAITMFALGLGLAITGYLMSIGNKETFEDIHELMANTFIIIVGLHIAGLILHSLRHQDTIALSMIDGKKELSSNNESIPSSRRFAGLLLMALVVSAGLYLSKNFNSENGTLKLFGQTLQLGENKSENENKNEVEKNEDENDEDESDD